MSYTPLTLNTLGAFVNDIGFRINPDAVTYMGSSTATNNYTPGTIVSTTSLNNLSQAINAAYALIGPNPTTQISQSTYNSLISIGSATIPALGLAPPTTYTNTYIGAITRYGWLRLPAYQAYKEFYINNGSYSDFLNTFATSFSKMQQLNSVIKAINNAPTYLNGIYSNMNDLITADITGVNLSTFYWGQDLIATGKVIDLTTIDKFGSPSNLLRILYKNKAITRAVNIALLSAGLSSTEVTNITNGNPASVEQEKLIYGAFCIVIDTDLTDVLIPLNVQTEGLESLADLLNVKMLFPNSYKSLTYPQYNSIALPTNSKTYYLTFKDGQVDIKNDIGIGDRLLNLIPEDVAFSADAFRVAMLQIRNIQSMKIEKFSQVVMNLENINGLAVGGTNIPTNVTLANNASTALAKGSSINGVYNMCDFFGCMTSLHYPWQTLQQKIAGLQSTTLTGIYVNILSLVSGPGPYESTLPTLIGQANTEIALIQGANSAQAASLNTTYNIVGTLFNKEENARLLALPGIADLQTTPADTVAFIDSLKQYAVETELKGPAQVLENIANITNEGGINLIASMREARNAQRLGLTGIEQDNNISGSVEIVLPRVSGSTLADSPIPGYPNSLTLLDIPIDTGAAITPGSFAGSSETTLIPTNLSILIQPADVSVLSPDQAVEDVILCNCDCWDML